MFKSSKSPVSGPKAIRGGERHRRLHEALLARRKQASKEAKLISIFHESTGVPIVWPCFGPAPKEPPFDKLTQHGFARSHVWNYDKGDDPAVAVFSG